MIPEELKNTKVRVNGPTQAKVLELETELALAVELLEETLEDHKGWNDCNDGRECQWCVDAKKLTDRQL